MDLKTAQNYVALGFSLLPVFPANHPDVDKRKKPVTSLLTSGQWGTLQRERPRDEQLSAWFGNGHDNAIALIGGTVSGGLVCIDLDVKADLTGHLLEDISELLSLENPDLYKRLTRQKTVSNGEHWLFRTAQTIGNLALACRLGVPGRPREIDEKTNKPKKIKLIETKSEGGYFLVFPSQGYSFLAGDLSTVPTLTEAEVETIFTIARSFDQLPQEQKTYVPAQREFTTTATDLTPWDDYNQRATIGDVLQCLEGAGWIPVPKGESYRLRRPGATTGTHASLGAISALLNFFHVFSDSAAPFAGGKTYSPFAVLALCQYSGDYSRAAKELFAKGYGKKSAAQNDTRDTTETATVPVEPWSAESLSVCDLFKVEPPPVEMLVPDCIPKGVVGVLYAAGGATKSVATLRLAVDLAVADSNGVSCKWLDRFSIEKSARTLYLHLEDQEEDLARRIWAIRSTISFSGFVTPTLEEITDRINKNLFVLRRESVFAGDADTFVDAEAFPTAKFERLLRTCDIIQPGFIVIDTRTKASRADENKTDLAAADVEVWTRLRDKTGANVLLNAHTNKNARNPDATDQGMNSLRGAGSYADNARLLIGLRPTGLAEDGKPIIEVSNPKNTRTKLFEKFTVKFDYPRYSLSTDKGKGNTIVKCESLSKMIGERPEWSFTDLTAAIMISTRKSEATAIRRIKQLVIFKEIVKNDSGTYSPVRKQYPEVTNYIHD
jgi:hypothetical protein